MRYVAGLCWIVIFCLGDGRGSEAQQTPDTLTRSQTIESTTEARSVLKSAQAQLLDVPKQEKTIRKQLLKDTLDTDGELNGAIGTDKLSQFAAGKGNLNALDTQQTMKLIQDIQTTQQARDPTLTPTPPNQAAVENLLKANSRQIAASSTVKAQKIISMLDSVGRLLWAVKGSGDVQSAWTFEGTVFVSSKGVVATNCHVIEPILDTSSGIARLRVDRMAIVDFSGIPLSSNGTLPSGTKQHRVLSIAAVSKTRGCDVATLVIEGADDIPPLTLSSSNTVPARIAVLGYPKLSDLNDAMCPYAVDLTTQMFCRFAKVNAGYAKVISEGPTYPQTIHSGVFSYASTTRGGQSGSPVIDLLTLEVIGIHYCCTGYSGPDVDSTLPCTTWHAQDPTWNEAISSSAVFADPVLKPYFLYSTPQVAKALAPPPPLRRSMAQTLH